MDACNFCKHILTVVNQGVLIKEEKRTIRKMTCHNCGASYREEITVLSEPTKKNFHMNKPT